MSLAFTAFLLIACHSLNTPLQADNGITTKEEITSWYPAADEKAAHYRTGTADPLVNRIGFTSFSQLAADLSRDNPDPFLLVKRFHDWITLHIAYDNDAFYGITSDINSAVEAVHEGRATCGGYADILEVLCREAAIPYRKVVGLSRENFDTNTGDMATHVWSQVQIEGKWYIVDTTHDSRLSINENRRGELGAYRDFYLFPAPEAKIMKNRPLEEEYQLLQQPITPEQFIEQPQFSPLTGVYGIRFLRGESTPLQKRRSPAPRGGRYQKVSDLYRAEGGIVKIVLEIDKNTLVYPRLRGSNGKIIPTAAEAKLEETGFVTCYIAPPGDDIYSAYISARNTKPYDSKAIKIYQFFVQGDSELRKTVFTAKEPWITPAARLYEAEIIELHHNIDGSTDISIKTQAGVSLFGGRYSPGDISVKQSGFVQVENLTGERALIHHINLPPAGDPHLQVWVKAKPKDQSHYNDVIIIIDQ